MSQDDPLEQAIDSVADRAEAEWDALESSAEPSSRSELRALRLIARLARAHQQAFDEDAPSPAVPFTWGGFEARELIARGAHGSVYRAWDARLERDVALKLLNTSRRDDAVLREGRLLARVRHPNVISVYGADRIDGHAGLWMELVEGRTLRQLVDQSGPLACAEAGRIGSDICGAVQALHDAGLVHRDVNARNVMRDESGRTIVMDLGAADDVAADVESVEGTPLYLAPELLEGGRPSPATDVYAIGVVLFFLVSGTFPLSGRTVAELRQVLRGGGLARLKPRPGCDARFCTVVNRALAVRPADRFASAAEMQAALQPASPRTGLLLAALLTIVVAIIWVAFGRRAGAPDAYRITSETRLTSDAMVEIDPALSPDGRVLAYSAGAPGHMRVMLRPVSGGAPGFLTARALGDERRPRWSPDGKSILFTCGPTLAIAALDTRQVARFDLGAFIRSAVWTARDGDILYIAEDVLYRFIPANGNVERLRHLEFEAGGLSLAPDGRRIAYSTGNAEFVSGTTQFGNIGGSVIRVRSIDGNDSFPVTDGAHVNISPVWSDNTTLFFVSDRDGERDIYSVAVDAQNRAGTPMRLTTGLNAFAADISSPTGALVYSTLRRPANLWMLPLPQDRVSTSADMRRLTSGDQTIEEGGLSDDGHFLYFDSNADGIAKVLRVHLPDGRPEPMTPSNVDSFFNDISPDGRELAYHTLQDGKRDAFVLGPGDPSPVRVGSGLAGQFSPDGRRLTFAAAHMIAGRPGRHFIAQRSPSGVWAITNVVRHGSCLDLMHWTEDGDALIDVCDGGIRLLSLEGTVRSTIYQPHDSRDPVPQFCSAPHHGTIVFKSYDTDGAAMFWSIPITGGTPRLRARFTDPERQAGRVEFTGNDQRVVLSVDTPQAEIWVARLGR